MLGYIIRGGFLKGYRTYVFGALAVLAALAHFATGDQSLSDLVSSAPALAGGLGLMSLRAAIAELAPILVQLIPLLARGAPGPSAAAVISGGVGPVSPEGATALVKAASSAHATQG